MSNEAKILIGVSIVTVIIVVLGAFYFGGNSAPQQTSSQPIKNTDALQRADSNVKKGNNAKVTLVEFGDFQCPACGAAHPIVKQIQSTYGDKINFVFRNFPLQMHQNAKIAAEAAEAAGEQGKYFEMHDLLYDNQSAWESSSKPLDLYKDYAKQLNLDVDKFAQAVESNKFEKKIQEDVNDGYAVNVSSTPTFFINGVKQEGGLPFNEFKQKIDDAMKKASSK